MADTDVEKSSYGAFERFLYIFLIPVLFIFILLAVLLALIDSEARGAMQKVANEIPVISSIVPDPVQTNSSVGTVASKETLELKKKMTEQLKLKDAELQSMVAQLEQQEAKIAELEQKNAQIAEQMQEKTISDEEYNARVSDLASVYTKMSPSKAAPILENLTNEERVLVFTAMKQDQRAKILEKMDPKIAADTSIMMKDVQPLTNQELEALRSRLELQESQQNPTVAKLTTQDLAATFANMTPANAASVLLELWRLDSKKAIAILQAMDAQARSSIMDAIAAESKTDAAKLSARLGK